MHFVATVRRLSLVLPTVFPSGANPDETLLTGVISSGSAAPTLQHHNLL